MASDTSRRTSQHDRRRFFERRLTWLAAGTGLPGAVAAGLLLWIGHFSLHACVIVAVATFAAWGMLVYLLRSHVIRPLQTIANMGAALHEGDFSMRIRGASADDAMGVALLELNRLGGVLQEQRRSALDASALAHTVMREIDIAVFAFDDAMILRLVNRAGERLIGHRAEWAIGRDAQTLGLAECLTGDAYRTLDVPFKGTTNRWQLRRTTLRRGGRPHQLVVLADLSRALRDEERSAWQRLLRVLGHEINNSLAPIQSLAATLRDHVSRIHRAPDWEEDLDQGLAVIESRSAALSRFMASYAQLARLPAPTRVRVDVEEWVRRIARMEMRVAVEVEVGPSALLHADADQLDQLLINLIRNAADASLETGGGVRVGWDVTDSAIDVWVRDEGLGLPDTANLFVPFFTTKPGGSGIGLVLSRQIAEAHGGSLDLVDGNGCEARVHLPIG